MAYNLNMSNIILKSNRQTILLYLITIALQLISIQTQPIGFAVVRVVSPSLRFEQFLSAIGRPMNDNSMGTQSGYNIISLGGFNQKTQYNSLDSSLSPIMIWKKIHQIIFGNKPNIYGSNSQQIQANIINNIYRPNNSRLLMHIDLRNLQVTKMNSTSSAENFARDVVTAVNQMSLDGISIQFMDYKAVRDGVASQWLQAFLKCIKQNSEKNDIMTVLIVPPTLVNKMKIFKSQYVNSLVDYFVLKYYNNVQPDYTSYQNLFQRAGYFTQSALFQIQRKPQILMDICRTLIAKPANQMGSWNTAQFIDSSILATAFGQAYNKIGWFAGYANLNFQTDPNSVFVNTVLSSLRDQCSRMDNCFC